MIYKYEFEVRQIELFGLDEEGRKKCIEQHKSYAKRALFNYVHDKSHIEFKEHLHSFRYKASILVHTEQEWIDFRNKIRDFLYTSVPYDIYKEVNELFKQFEIGNNGNTQP